MTEVTEVVQVIDAMRCIYSFGEFPTTGAMKSPRHEYQSTLDRLSYSRVSLTSIFAVSLICFFDSLYWWYQSNHGELLLGNVAVNRPLVPDRTIHCYAGPRRNF